VTWTGDVARSTPVKRAGGRGWWGMLGRGGGALGRSWSTLVKRAGGSGWPLMDEGALEHGGQSTRARAHGGCGGGSRCLIAEVDTRVGGSEKSAHGWSSRRLRRDETIVPCRLAEEGGGEGAQKIMA